MQIITIIYLKANLVQWQNNVQKRSVVELVSIIVRPNSNIDFRFPRNRSDFKSVFDCFKQNKISFFRFSTTERLKCLRDSIPNSICLNYSAAVPLYPFFFSTTVFYTYVICVILYRYRFYNSTIVFLMTRYLFMF